MKLLFASILFALPLRPAVSSMSGSGSLKIVPCVPSEQVLAVPWVRSCETSRAFGRPSFSLKGEGVSISAEGWVAMTDTDLLIRVEVADAQHRNDGELWGISDGDNIRVCLDAWGDGAGSAPPDTEIFAGPDDAVFRFALSAKKGPVGWCYRSANARLNGEALSGWIKIVRDDKSKITRYDLRLPWAEFAVQAGQVPEFGLAIQIVSRESKKSPASVLTWGGDEQTFLPARFQRLRPGNPPEPVRIVAPLQMDVWTPQQSLVAMVALSSPSPGEVTVRAGGLADTAQVKREEGSSFRHFRIEYRPAAGSVIAPLEVKVNPLEPGEEALSRTFSPEFPGDAVERLFGALDQLMQGSPHPLFTRHLLSVRSLVQSEWARASSLAASDTTAAAEVRDQAVKLLSAFQGGAGRWESYWRDGLPLCFTFVSKVDNTLQRYLVTLPRGWDPQRDKQSQEKFPLLVELHGYGNPNPLTNVANWLDLSDEPFVRHGRTFASRDRSGFHVQPHGRGNSGYLGIGDTDVWEALEDFGQSFAYDENRQYLFGFSMGGGGTWRLALHSPDRWAAIALYAPSIAQRGGTPEPLAENLRSLPVWIWSGEADERIEDLRRTAAQLGRFGNTAVTHSSPGVPHEYLAEWQEAGVRWLLQQTRHRSDSMVFVASADGYSGAWGIEIKRDPTICALPRIACRVAGNTVSLDTTGTSEVRINLGEGGLGLQGETSVILNGAGAYKGPAGKLVLPISSE